MCDECLRELFDPPNPRYQYPYINCTNCGPRYTVILALPYDRPNTTMKPWPLDPTATVSITIRPIVASTLSQLPALVAGHTTREGRPGHDGDDASIRRTVDLLREGKILAVKGLGGYHLACDARMAAAVAALRERKYRKEKAFAVMAKDVETARLLVELSPEAETLLRSTARPIVLAKAKADLPGVAPDNDELGVMLPYTPMHHLLFAAGAPEILVMTSANHSSEPIAYEDQMRSNVFRV